VWLGAGYLGLSAPVPFSRGSPGLDVLAAASDFSSALDTAVPPGKHPRSADALHEVVAVTAIAHGEWIRIHPFVNGNGRTARLLAAHIALRYGLPVFVTLKPRPDDVAYARAAKGSMGRPPDFTGDHTEAVAVFAHLLSLILLGP
jgi:fido (protein-threonine AMPylation protein)